MLAGSDEVLCCWLRPLSVKTAVVFAFVHCSQLSNLQGKIYEDINILNNKLFTVQDELVQLRCATAKLAASLNKLTKAAGLEVERDHAVVDN